MKIDNTQSGITDHNHDGLNSPKIDFKNLKNTQSGDTNNGKENITASDTSLVVNCGFQPKLVKVTATRFLFGTPNWGISWGSWSANGSVHCIYTYYDGSGWNTAYSGALGIVYDNTHTSRTKLTNLTTSSTGFTITISPSPYDIELIWEAWS